MNETSRNVFVVRCIPVNHERMMRAASHLRDERVIYRLFIQRQTYFFSRVTTTAPGYGRDGYRRHQKLWVQLAV